MIRTITIPATLAVALAFTATGGGAGPRFFSPGGRYEVEFRARVHREYDGNERMRSLDAIDHLEYEITFFPAGTNRVVATSRYTDVYGFDRPPEPTPVTEVFRRFDWSPNDDFVLLPVEGWAGAPGTSERTARALHPDLGWSEARFALDRVEWIDRFVALGDRHDDCDYSVDRFDGKTGEQIPVAAPASPIGYEIASISGRDVVVRKVLDNCRRTEDLATFREQCLSLDLDTWVLSPEPCPD